jgi:Tol biopolymer transport system component
MGLLGVASAALGSPNAIGLAYITGDTNGGHLGVWVATASGTHQRKLNGGGIPALAPNGQLVAVSSGAGPSALVLYTSAGAVDHRFFNAKQVSAGPLAWSPDSRYLAVGLTDVNDFKTIGKSGVAVIDTTSGTTTMIAGGYTWGLSWSPTGDTLVYGLATSQSANPTVNLYTSNPTRTARAQLTNDGHSGNPVWGKRGIAFDRIKNRPKWAPAYQIYLLSGGHAQQITHTKPGLLVSGLAPIAVSADGTRVAADYGGQDTDSGYTVDLVTHKVTQLRAGQQNVTAWGISRDGKRVLVSVGGFQGPPSTGKVETMPFGGGAPALLVAHGDNPSWNQ